MTGWKRLLQLLRIRSSVFTNLLHLPDCLYQLRLLLHGALLLFIFLLLAFPLSSY